MATVHSSAPLAHTLPSNLEGRAECQAATPGGIVPALQSLACGARRQSRPTCSRQYVAAAFKASSALRLPPSRACADMLVSSKVLGTTVGSTWPASCVSPNPLHGIK